MRMISFQGIASISFLNNYLYMSKLLFNTFPPNFYRKKRFWCKTFLNFYFFQFLQGFEKINNFVATAPFIRPDRIVVPLKYIYFVFCYYDLEFHRGRISI